MREVVLGTAGHVDHGKTSLVRALTGINTDRLREEQERGITIELGFAFLDLPCGHRLGIVDVPGHEKFVRNMVAGAAGIDIVAMVIAADEGIMPQTREHLDICRLLGVQKGCIIVTKIDLVDEEWLEMVVEDIRSSLAGTFLDSAPLVCVSTVTGQGLDQVVAVFDELVRSHSFTEASGPFRLPVDRVFTMKGFGVVVTGTAISGTVGVGDPLMVYPAGLATRARTLQVHGESRERGEAGHRTAVSLQGLEKDQLHRGDVVATPGCLSPTYVIDADFTYLAGNERPLKNRTRVRVHLGTAEIMGRILLLEADEIAPGETAPVQLLLEEPFGVWPGDHYVVRSYSPVFTIGGGVVYANVSRKRKRLTGKAAERFAIYRRGEMAAGILAHLEEASLAGLSRDELAVRLGVFGKRLDRELAPLLSKRKVLQVEADGGRLLAGSVYTRLQGRLVAILADYHREFPLQPGIGQEEIAARLGRGVDGRLLQFLLRDTARGGAIVIEAGIVRLPEHEVRFADADRKVREALEKRFAEAGLKPPRKNELLAELADYPASLVTEILGVLEREGGIVRVSEELYFDAHHLAELEKRIKAHLTEHGEIDAQGFKQLTGLTRKFSIPLLEYFDRRKLTLRVGDKRILRGA